MHGEMEARQPWATLIQVVQESLAGCVDGKVLGMEETDTDGGAKGVIPVKGSSVRGDDSWTSFVDLSPVGDDSASVPLLLWNLGPRERVNVVKHGLLADSIADLAGAMHISEGSTKYMLGLPDSTISRKIKLGQPLAQDQGERVLGMIRLIGLTEQIVADHGDPDQAAGFDAARWLGEWIERPQPSLGMKKPSEYLDTATGLEMVETLLKRIAVGAFA
ncbi:MAG: DUF2384 domain-containing protein [Burkholderiaceae bacterium]|jgi:putative toxin-antitoxin system antitoxin component (TIGR02293 family)|nr:DUF2384 domain-containing protein [Burkholderiaceae bacterium]